MSNFQVFSQLHNNPSPLLIANIWDVNSAKIFEKKGFKAVATSSAAVANTFGYDDGENLPFDTLLLIAKRTVESVKIPVSVDLEGGFSRSVAGITDNIKRLHDVGVAGINFEDTVPGSTRQLKTVDEFQKLLSDVAEGLSKSNLKIYINVRTDGFLLGMASALKETLTRIKRYETSGASGIFVPCIVKKEDIEQVVAASQLPINVMCMPGLPSFSDLTKIGVKRISMGTFVHSYLNKKLEDISETITRENSFESLFK